MNKYEILTQESEWAANLAKYSIVNKATIAVSNPNQIRESVALKLGIVSSMVKIAAITINKVIKMWTVKAPWELVGSCNNK